jgi:hypothetical protein
VRATYEEDRQTFVDAAQREMGLSRLNRWGP